MFIRNSASIKFHILMAYLRNNTNHLLRDRECQLHINRIVICNKTCNFTDRYYYINNNDLYLHWPEFNLTHGLDYL